MDLTPEGLRGRLELIAEQGWDGPVADHLLTEIRDAVVRPVVRATRLRGPAADQAEASGWSAAWDAIRRPSARTALNPGGMVWSAVQRAVHADVRAAVRVGVPTAILPEQIGWDEPSLGGAGTRMSRLLLPISELLVSAGWPRDEIAEVFIQLGDAGDGRSWRRVSKELGLPAWQVRRVAVLVLGGSGQKGLLGLVATDGANVLGHPAAVAGARSTRVRWQCDPTEWLGLLAADLARQRSAAIESRPPVGAPTKATYPCASVSPRRFGKEAE